MSYQVWAKDGFDPEAEPYHLDGLYEPKELEIQPEYETLEAAQEAAGRYLAHLNETQPNAGGPLGIQDRVYIHMPGGGLRQVFSTRGV